MNKDFSNPAQLNQTTSKRDLNDDELTNYINDLKKV